MKIWRTEKRRPRNDAEGIAYDEFVARGLDAMKRGWPDFVVFVGTTLVAVEVKPDKEPFLRRPQMIVTAALVRQGVPCFMFTPSGGFQPLHGSPSFASLMSDTASQGAT